MHHQSPSRQSWPLQNGSHSRTGGSMAKVIEKNIAAVDEYRRESEHSKSAQDHVADLITRWSGSMWFIYAHVAWFGFSIALNVNWLGVHPFDPFPFGLLTTIVSLEAIFLSTFVLVSQNRQAELADRRAELDLQINLLAEYEMTRVLTLVDAIAKKLDVTDCNDGELAELEEDVKPDELLDRLDPRHSKPAD